MMNYRAALEFLNRRGNEVQGIHLGLHRAQALMEALGNPHLRYAVLHIGGTNGKGSVAAMSESILRHAGWKTGLYTSPHLVRVEERIRIGGREISPRQLASLISRIRDAEAVLLRGQRLERPLTWFEFITCCAFQCFAQEKVDVAVVEVGLGGTMDATNIVYPQTCVITGVSYDHQNILGRTLSAIAGEKAGILKPGRPAITACRAPAALRVIRRMARVKGVPLLEIDRDCKIRILRETADRFVFDLQTPRRYYPGLHLSLAGRHQMRNAAVAVCAVEALRPLPVRALDIRRGIAATRWPGRLDEYRLHRRTLLEGAHNQEGTQLLRAHLESRREKEIHLVFSALRDKDIRKMGGELFPVANSIHLAPLNNSRTADPKDIVSMFKRFASRIRIHGSSREALLAAWQESSRDGLVVVTGSLYLLGELLPYIQKRLRGD
jgi:dihydrofolate synthase/folylpolyglutamate synthase